jgi:hypothetical protein
MKLIVKYFFLCRHFISGGLSKVWINIFFFGRCVFWVVCLRFESTCIQVNTVNNIKQNCDFTNIKRCKCMYVCTKTHKHVSMQVWNFFFSFGVKLVTWDMLLNVEFPASNNLLPVLPLQMSYWKWLEYNYIISWSHCITYSVIMWK